MKHFYKIALLVAIFLSLQTNSFSQKHSFEIKDLHITEGGNIILTQIEIEFGSYVTQQKNISFEQHKKYAESVKNKHQYFKYNSACVG